MVTRFVNWWAEWVVERRMLVIAVSLVLTVLVVLPMKNLYFDNSNEMWFLEGDPALTNYDQLQSHFGDSEYFLIGIEARPGETVFTKDYIEAVYQITDFLENHDFLANLDFDERTRANNQAKFVQSADADLGAQFGGEEPAKKRSHPVRAVTKVQSLTTYQMTKSNGDNLDVVDLFPEDPSDFTGSPEELKKAEELMKGETLVHDQLISSDFRHAMISARATYLKGTIDHHVQLVRQTKAFIEEKGFEKQGFKFHFTGNPDISENFFSSSMADQGLTLPLMFLLIVVVLISSFRTVAGLTMPLLVIVGSVITTMGMIGAMGWAMNMLNVTLPIILMAVGIGDSVHILIEFYHNRARGLDSKEASKEAVKHLFVPCFNTSLTTGLGFLSIAVSKLQPLREFGIVAAFGVLVAFVISVGLLPAMMSFTKSKETKAQQLAEGGLVARWTSGITDFDFKHSKLIALSGLVIVLLSLYFASSVRVNANFIDYFKKDAPMRTDLDYFNETYKGGFYLEFIVDSGKEQGLLDPQFMKRVLELQNWLETTEGAGKTNSFLNMLMKFNQAMHGDDPAWNILPDSQELAAQYLLLYSNGDPTEDLTDQKTFDEREMRISLRLVNRPTNEMKAYVSHIQEVVNTDFKDLNVTITGLPVLYNNMDSYILNGIVRSFLLALISILICFVVLLRSLKYGLLAIIPSLFPIVLAGGIMGLMGLYLNFASMIIASVTFGIAVDDTIHIMSRYIKVRATGATRKQAVHAAVTETGKAITFTTLILFFGFSILMLSTFIPNVHLGFFAAVILMVALIASLTLLPAVIFLQKDKAEL